MRYVLGNIHKQINFIRPVVSYLFFTFVFIGCGKLPGFSVTDKSDEFRQSSSINDQLDVLFVVDNSGSMAGEQQILADNFDLFINNFSDIDLKFHVGVIATDATDDDDWWNAKGVYNLPGGGTLPAAYDAFFQNGPGSLLSTLSTRKFIDWTQSTADIIADFNNNVKLGVNGSGAEAPLLAVLEAIGPQISNGWNADFFRRDSFLSVIVVTDEDESAHPETAAYLRDDPEAEAQRIDEVVNALIDLKGSESLVQLDSISVLDEGNCPVDGFDKTKADTIESVVGQLRGSLTEICGSFADSLENLGREILIALTRFKLLQAPAEGSGIEVVVNDKIIPEDPDNGWVYLEETQEIEFRGDEIPPPGAVIQVRYIPSAPT